MLSEMMCESDDILSSTPLSARERLRLQIAAYQMYLTYCEIARHYFDDKRKLLSYHKFVRSSYMEPLYEKAERIIEEGRKVEDFVEYFFWAWSSKSLAERNAVARSMSDEDKEHCKVGGSTYLCGVDYPSLKALVEDTKHLLDSFSYYTAYVPRTYRTEAMRLQEELGRVKSVVNCWCTTNKESELNFWLTQYDTWSKILVQCSPQVYAVCQKRLRKYGAQIKKSLGVSVEDLLRKLSGYRAETDAPLVLKDVTMGET